MYCTSVREVVTDSRTRIGEPKVYKDKLMLVDRQNSIDQQKCILTYITIILDIISSRLVTHL